MFSLGHERQRRTGTIVVDCIYVFQGSCTYDFLDGLCALRLPICLRQPVALGRAECLTMSSILKREIRTVALSWIWVISQLDLSCSFTKRALQGRFAGSLLWDSDGPSISYGFGKSAWHHAVFDLAFSLVKAIVSSGDLSRTDSTKLKPNP